MDNEFKVISFFLFGFLSVILIALLLSDRREKEKIEVEKQKVEAIKAGETSKVIKL